MTLSPDHLEQLITRSGITEAIVKSTGCYTATTTRQLAVLTFRDYQQRVPALVMPVYDVHGNVALHQIRHDHPRVNKRKKPVKYETPADAKLVLSVSPAYRPLLQEATVPLLVIEGLKKQWSIESRLDPAQPLLPVGVIGTNGWQRYNQPLPDWQALRLKGRTVLIVYDSDAVTVAEVGKARQALARFLQQAGADVFHVDLPALPGAKCGVDDYFVQGHTLQELLALAQETFPRPRPLLIHGADVVPEDITYVWPPYLPRQMVTMLDGDPDVGKTGVACMLAAAVSRGFPLPDQTGKPALAPDGPGHVLMVQMEDLLGSVIVPRLKKCDADLAHITFLNERQTTGEEPRPFTLDDLPLLTAYLDQTRPRLVYIDAIMAVLGPKADISRANVMTALLGPLAALAKRYDCAVLCSRHPAKPGQNTAKVLYRGMGSQAIIGTARSGLFVEEHPDDPTKSLLVHYKGNTSAKGCTLLFSKARGHFEWCGTTRITHQMLAGDGGPGPLPRQRLQAMLWLEEHLKDGCPRKASEIYETASRDHDWSEKTVRTASESLKVTKTPIQSDFLWSLASRRGTGASGVSGSSGSSGSSGVPWNEINNLCSVQQDSQPLNGQSVPCVHATHDTPVRGGKSAKNGKSEENQTPMSRWGGDTLGKSNTYVPPENGGDLRELGKPDNKSIKSNTYARPTPGGAENLSPYCPGCGRNTTWLMRDGRAECYKCHTPRPHA
jgi:hypothetical protein